MDKEELDTGEWLKTKGSVNEKKQKNFEPEIDVCVNMYIYVFVKKVNGGREQEDGKRNDTPCRGASMKCM